MELKLQEAQERALYAVVRMAEDKLHAMEYVIRLHTDPAENISAPYNNDVPEEQMQRIQDVIRELKGQVISLYEAYDFHKREPQSLKKELAVKATFLWEELTDATVERMKGYGEMEQDVKADYGRRINTLIATTERLINVCKQ